jgi:hypothetical protein
MYTRTSSGVLDSDSEFARQDKRDVSKQRNEKMAETAAPLDGKKLGKNGQSRRV